jgi:diguanylate cyclase (GGDEF)-like protein
MAKQDNGTAEHAVTGDKAARLVLGQRIGAGLSLCGSLTSYIGVVTMRMTSVAAGVQLALAVGFTLIGLVLALTKPRALLMKICVIWSVLAISAMLATADSFGTTPFFYLWPAVFAAYFCSARFLVGTLGFLASSLLGALIISPIDWAVKADTLIGTTLSVGLISGLVALMHAREERLHRELAQAAHTDPLTGLLNRRGFDPQFFELVATSADRDRPISVVMFDLDHFKAFNDRHGHGCGDEALRRMALILVGQCRDVDLVARLGGEEFAVVLPGAASADARSYAERVAWALGTETVDDALRLTTSSGIGAVEPGSTAGSMESILLRADEALYAAKAGGRSRAAWWVGNEVEVGEIVEIPDAVHDHAASVPIKPREYVLRRNDAVSDDLRKSA